MNKPTDEQIKEFWEWCGFKKGKIIADEQYWWYPAGGATLTEFPIPIDLNNLFKYAVPLAIEKLEDRLYQLTHDRRAMAGLQLLFEKWVNKIMEGYSIEDALFWAIYKVIKRDIVQPTGTLYYYNMALQMGGLMEDPDFHPEFIRTVHASSLKEAKDKWAKVTDYDKKESWNPETQTYWGWSVICLGSDDPNAKVEKDF